MTDAIFPTGLSRLASPTLAFTVLADNGTANGYLTLSDIAALMPTGSSGAGTGTINMGGANHLAYYSASGTAVSPLTIGSSLTIANGEDVFKVLLEAVAVEEASEE